MEVWRMSTDSDANAPNLIARPKAVAQHQYKMKRNNGKDASVGRAVSMSWDGSLIAISGLQSWLEVYKFSGSSIVEQNTVSRPGLAYFRGRGQFHGGHERNMENEVFLALGDENVMIFSVSVQDSWAHLRTIHQVSLRNIDSIQARHFTHWNDDSTLTIWSIDSGHACSTIRDGGDSVTDRPTCTLSLDASRLILNDDESGKLVS
ncbi:hypothetical protein BGZ83_002553 [Gryganskiella cystojenkinii]|nr:hypothetical protein BGZ83_002553 [Gryganskiella cystojenkinii]